MRPETAVFVKTFNALMRRAEAGGEGAAEAARKAGALAAGIDPERARRAWAAAAALDPLDTAPRIALSRLAAANGDLTGARREAQTAFDQAIDAAERGFAAFALGEIAEARGDPAEARARFESAKADAEAVLAADPHDASAAHDLAAARQRLAELALQQGDLAGAEAGHDAACALLSALAERESSPALTADLGFAHARLADLALERDDLSAARSHAQRAEGFYEALARARPRDAGLAEARAALMTLSAEICRRDNDYEGARSAMDGALALRVRSAAGDPAQRGQLLSAWRRQAALLAETGETQLAEAARAQARSLAEALHKERPEDEAAGANYLQVLFEDAEAATLHGDLERARRALADCVRLADARLAQAPRDLARAATLVRAWTKLGDVGLAAGKPAAACEAFSRAHAVARLAHEAAPDDLRAKARAHAALKYGEAASAAGDHGQARAAILESLRLRIARADARKDDRGALLDVAVALERLGLAALAAGDASAARGAWHDELKLAPRIFPETNQNALRFAAIVRGHLAGLGGDEAGHHRKAALDALDQLAASGALTDKDQALRKQLWDGRLS